MGMKMGVSILKSEGVLLTVIPFFGSVLALAYEVGVLSFYDVPRTLIQLDFVRVVRATAVTAVFAAAYSIIALLFVAFIKGAHPLKRLMVGPVIFGIFITPFIYLSPNAGKWWVAAGFIAVWLVFALVRPLFSKGSAKPYFERLKDQLDSDDALRQNTENGASGSSSFNTIAANLAIALFAAIAVTGLGRKMTEENESHWILQDSSTWVLAASYGELYIFKEVDLKTRQIGSMMKLVKVGNPSDLSLSNIRLGQLKASPHLPIAK
jgi:hypothetical protein